MNAHPPVFCRRAWILPLIPLLIWFGSRLFITDVELFYALNQFGQHWSDGTLAFFVFLGNGWGLLALAFPLVIFAPRPLVASAAAGLMAGLLGRILKNSLDVSRPAAVLDRETFRIVGDVLEALSMPSGHTLTVFAIATTLYFSLKQPYRIHGIWLFGLAIISGLTRTAVGAHWPSDVFAGAAIGLFFGLVAVQIFTKLPQRWFDPQGWLTRLAAIMGLVSVYILATHSLEIGLIKPLQTLGIVIVIATLFHFVPMTLRHRSS